MSKLTNYQMVLVGDARAAPVQKRLRELEAQGATLRLCSPELDLWSAISEQAYDALLFCPSPEEARPLAFWPDLAQERRVREIPALALLETNLWPRLSALLGQAPLGFVAASISEAELVQLLVEWAEPRRRLREVLGQIHKLEEARKAEALGARQLSDGFASLSHDLRAFLGVIYGFCCNLRDEIAGPLTADQRLHVARVLEAVEGASALLTANQRQPRRTYSQELPRIAAALPSRSQRSLVQLTRLSEQVLRLFEHSAVERQLSLSGSFDETVLVWGDALRVKQLIVNLVVNAMKYTPPGGKVHVAVRWSKDAAAGTEKSARRRAEILVSDTGLGIPVADRERIFERGFRLERDRAQTGEGLGLALVREICDQHNGSIQVSGESGNGTVFTVSLPPDMRARAREGILVLAESEAADWLIEFMQTGDAWRALSPENASYFLKQLADCAALLVLPRHKTEAVQNALARLRSLSGRASLSGGSP